LAIIGTNLQEKYGASIFRLVPKSVRFYHEDGGRKILSKLWYQYANQHGVMHVTFTFVFAFDRNFKILILWNSGRDRSVTTANVSGTN